MMNDESCDDSIVHRSIYSIFLIFGKSTQPKPSKKEKPLIRLTACKNLSLKKSIINHLKKIIFF